MVAALLGLRLRILVNTFRRPPAQLAGLVVAVLLAVGGVVLFWVGADWMRGQDLGFALRAVPVVGSWLSAAAVLLPVIFVRRQELSPRAFLGYELSAPVVALIFLGFALIGPGLLLIPLAFAPVTAWTEPASVQIAWGAAPLLFLQGLVSIELARRLGAALRHHPRAAGWISAASVVVLLVGAALVVVTLAARIPALYGLARLASPLWVYLRPVPDALGATPLGVLWAAPGWASTAGGNPGAAGQALGAGALLVTVLLVAWVVTVGAQLRPTRRRPRTRLATAPGAFGRFPANPTGAIAARSFTYWVRDPRYRAVFAVLPIVPIVALLALWVGGVPFSTAVLVPLPLMTLLLAWSTIHNDVAYDSSAVWQHVAAQTRGIDDRRGRAVPVLIWGAVLLAVGVPLTVWGNGHWQVAAPLGGVCLALLLGGVGVGSLYSARFPYAAPHPGDAAWQSPQTTASQGGVAQGASLLLILLVAVPALGAAALWWLDGGAWGWVALGVGVLAGAAMVAIGWTRGGLTFERRGPELLDFTLRN